MIIEIENFDGNTIGAIEVTENNKDGVTEVKQTIGDISIADIDIDDIFETNEDKIRIQLEKDKLAEICDVCITYGYLIGTETTMDTEEQVNEMVDSYNLNNFNHFAKLLEEKERKLTEDNDDYCSYQIFDLIQDVFSQFLGSL